MSDFRDRAARAFRNPARAAFHVVSSLAPGPFWQRYVALSRRQGLRRPYLLLSFDCETDLDTTAVPEVRRACTERRLPAAFAVPGEILKRGAETYAALASANGCELINHGYRQHTVQRSAVPGDTANSLEYGSLSEDEVIGDLRAGDRAHREVIGRAPVGFRTPHFGEFQGRRQLALIQAEAAALGYRYSSSTLPLAAFRQGPAALAAEGRLVELPVSGSHDRPHRVLDSWGYTAAPGRSVGHEDLVRDIRRLGAFHREVGTGIVNVYADPSQVASWSGFFDALGDLADLATTFGELAALRLGR